MSSSQYTPLLNPNNDVGNNAQSTIINRPSRWSFFWWQNYFSADPVSYFEEENIYYDHHGHLCGHERARREREYWNNSGWAYYYYDPFPFHYHFHYFHNGSNSGNNNNDNDNNAGLVYVIILAVFAFIIAGVLVYHYPPIMIFSWVILFFYSFVIKFCDRSSYSCFENIYTYGHIFVDYDFVSALAILVYISFVCYAVFKMQQLYKFYYPGTPGIDVDYDGLIRFFRLAGHFYRVSMIVSILFVAYGGLISFKRLYMNEAIYVTYCWVFVHGLNFLAALAMVKRMEEKRERLETPPAYSEHPEFTSRLNPESSI